MNEYNVTMVDYLSRLCFFFLRRDWSCCCCLDMHLVQNQLSSSLGGTTILTQTQWYQSSQLSQPIMAEPSSGRPHLGQIQILLPSSS